MVTWSLLPFAVNVMLNLSNIKLPEKKKKLTRIPVNLRPVTTGTPSSPCLRSVHVSLLSVSFFKRLI